MDIRDNPHYAAGYDAGLNGPNMTNCNFALFGSPENKTLWEQGNADGKRAYSMRQQKGRK